MRTSFTRTPSSSERIFARQTGTTDKFQIMIPIIGSVHIRYIYIEWCFGSDFRWILTRPMSIDFYTGIHKHKHSDGIILSRHKHKHTFRLFGWKAEVMMETIFFFVYSPPTSPSSYNRKFKLRTEYSAREMCTSPPITDVSCARTIEKRKTNKNKVIIRLR